MVPDAVLVFIEVRSTEPFESLRNATPGGTPDANDLVFKPIRRGHYGRK